VREIHKPALHTTRTYNPQLEGAGLLGTEVSARAPPRTSSDCFAGVPSVDAGGGTSPHAPWRLHQRGVAIQAPENAPQTSQKKKGRFLMCAFTRRAA
jgi:hypothetical protein